MNDRAPRATHLDPARSAATVADAGPAPGPWSPDEPPQDEAAAIRVDRARTELRHGRPVVVTDPTVADGTVLLVAAVETLVPARLPAFLRRAAPRLLLTAERLHALGLAHASTPRAFLLPPELAAEALQALAGSRQPAMPAPPPPADAGELADAAMLAALALCKRARLVPALLVARLPAESLAERPWLAVSTADVALAAPPRAPALRRVSDAQVPIEAHEDCTLVLFREVEGDAEHVAIRIGQPDPAQPVPVRLHSSCLTGDLLGSLRCDCGDQLERAITHLAGAGGVLLYLAQEGRGTGLANKLRAYRLQDGGLDTLDADRHLGFREDERDFSVAAAMLRELGIGRIRLLTNNPQKIAALRAAGIDVVDRVPLVAPTNAHNARYVQTKRDRAGHLREDEQQD